METRYVIRTIFFTILLLVVAILLYLGVVPDGKITYSYDFNKDSAFLSKLKPDTRLNPINEGEQTIIADPVYFSLRTPRSFDKAKLNIRYNSDNLNLPLIETGVLVDNTLWRYDTKPVENKIIDSTCSSWHKLEDKDLVLCQKQAKFASIDDFLNSSTTPDKIALYNYKMNRDFILDSYQALDEERTIDVGLRGTFQFYSYIKDELLNFELELIDLNENRDSDPINLNLYYNDLLISTRSLPDDGNESDDGVKSDIRALVFEVPDLPEGIYKLELRVNDDIVTKSIKTSQSKLAFANKIHFYNNGREDLKLFSDALNYEATSIYPGSLQTINIASSTLMLTKTYQQSSLRLDERALTQQPASIVLEKDGLILSGNGVFAFSEESMINPNFKKIDSSLNTSAGGVEYLLAKYRSPEEKNNWKEAEIEIDLSRAYRENRTYSFIISIPGLKSGSEGEQYIVVDNIEVELQGKNFSELVRNLLGR